MESCVFKDIYEVFSKAVAFILLSCSRAVIVQHRVWGAWRLHWMKGVYKMGADAREGRNPVCQVRPQMSPLVLENCLV